MWNIHQETLKDPMKSEETPPTTDSRQAAGAAVETPVKVLNQNPLRDRAAWNHLENLTGICGVWS